MTAQKPKHKKRHFVASGGLITIGSSLMTVSLFSILI